MPLLRSPYAAFLAVGLVSLASPLHAIDMKESHWCTVDNQTGNALTLKITDRFHSTGNLYVRANGDSSKGKELKGPGDKATLQPGLSQIYFDSTLKELAIKFNVSSSKGSVDFRATMGATEDSTFSMTNNNISGINVTLNTGSFRDNNGQTFLTFK